MATYNRLAAAKFHEHSCEPAVPDSSNATKPDADIFSVDRARMLIMRGYKPQYAVELILQEVTFASGGDARIIAKARADAEIFLSRIGQGLI